MNAGTRVNIADHRSLTAKMEGITMLSYGERQAGHVACQKYYNSSHKHAIVPSLPFKMLVCKRDTSTFSKSLMSHTAYSFADFVMEAAQLMSGASYVDGKKAHQGKWSRIDHVEAMSRTSQFLLGGHHPDLAQKIYVIPTNESESTLSDDMQCHRDYSALFGISNALPLSIDFKLLVRPQACESFTAKDVSTVLEN